MAQSLVKEMAADDWVTVLTCDLGCRLVGTASQVPSAQLSAALGEALFRVEPGGTSDLVRSIEEASRMAQPQGGRTTSLVYLGDGIATVGVRDPGRVAELAGGAAANARASVSTIAVGTTCDERMLAELARRTGGVAVGYAPGDDAPSLALRMLGRLRGSVLLNATVEMPAGAFEVAPASLPSIHAGEEVWVAAKYAGPVAGDVVLRGTVDGRPFESRTPVTLAEPTGAGNAFVPSMWAERRAVDLAAAGNQNREAIVALGTRFGLVTPFTSLLVLDSDALAERLGLGERVATAPQFTGEEEVDIATAQGQGTTEALEAPRTAAPAGCARPRGGRQPGERGRRRRPRRTAGAEEQDARNQAPASPAPVTAAPREPNAVAPGGGLGTSGSGEGGAARGPAASRRPMPCPLGPATSS